MQLKGKYDLVEIVMGRGRGKGGGKRASHGGGRRMELNRVLTVRTNGRQLSWVNNVLRILAEVPYSCFLLTRE